jgi:predicted AlkP superfamily phosphohydrolase/phosphomutase
MKKFAVGLLCVLLLGAAGYVVYRSMKPAPGPVIVIGLDGADWNLIDPLFQQGKLPNLRALKDGGTWGVFETFRPTKSPVVWTSIATGKTMLKHGVLDFKFVDENNIDIPYSVDDIRVKFLWEILSDNGFKAGVVNWYCTFPASEFSGYCISDRFRISVDHYLEYEGVTSPPELKDVIYPQVVRFADNRYGELIREENIDNYLTRARRFNIEIPAGRERQINQFRRYFLQDKSIENTALFMFEKIPVDFFAVYLRLIDTTSHFASIFIDEILREKWIEENEKHGGPTPETEKLLYANMVEVMETVYVYMDNVVGRIMSRAPENATFIVLSDHGFNFSPIGYNHYGTPKIPHGIIILNGPQIRAGHALDKMNVYDFVPTVLHLYGLPTGEDMDGRVVQEAFKKRRTVHSVETHETGPARAGAKKPRDLDKEVLEDLKTLGYIK